jgi:tetratricopeptide (TPR) repeat protein
MEFEFFSIRNFLSAGVLGLALLPWSCQRKPMASAPPPPPKLVPAPAAVPVPTPIPSSIPSLAPSPSYFDIGEKYFAAGDYAKAAQAYEAYLAKDSTSANRDAAYFRLALSHALPEGRSRDLPQAMKLLALFLDRFPQSPLRPQAELLLSFQKDIDRLRVDVGKRDERIKDLTLELEQLKQIDMQKRPTRPSP